MDHKILLNEIPRNLRTEILESSSLLIIRPTKFAFNDLALCPCYVVIQTTPALDGGVESSKARKRDHRRRSVRNNNPEPTVVIHFRLVAYNGTILSYIRDKHINPSMKLHLDNLSSYHICRGIPPNDTQVIDFLKSGIWI